MAQKVDFETETVAERNERARGAPYDADTAGGDVLHQSLTQYTGSA